MKAAAVSVEAKFKRVLYLTDFSQPSEAALPYAVSIAHGYGSKIYALNVFIPPSYVYTTPELTVAALEAEEETAESEMKKVASQLAGLPYETIVERGIEVWATVKRAIAEHHIDLVVVGTHGRTGMQKFLLGSVAEEIFRRSPVPVLTIGPDVRGSSVHNGARFHRVLFATDFSSEAAAAAPYAISLAEKGNARMILLHVVPKSRPVVDSEASPVAISVAEAMYRLYEIAPKDTGPKVTPDVAVEYGEPADRIIEVAKERDADIIVLGVRAAEGRMGAVTHLERATAHKVVAHAPCPVLTVRG